MSTYGLIHGGGDVGSSGHLITAAASGILITTLAARTILPD
jgi:hypothetical protein